MKISVNLKIAYKVPVICTLSSGHIPMSKSKKKIMPPCYMATKPVLVWRWAPRRPSGLVSQLLSWGVLSSYEETSGCFSGRSTSSCNQSSCLVCKLFCPGFPEVKGLVGEGSELSYFWKFGKFCLLTGNLLVGLMQTNFLGLGVRAGFLCTKQSTST